MANSKKELTVEYKLLNSEFNKGIKEINDDVGSLNKKFRLQQEQMRNTASQTDKFEANISKLNTQIELAERKTEETNKAYENAADLMGENSREAKTWANKLLDAERNEERLKNALDDTNHALDDHKEKVRLANSNLKKFGDNAQNAGSKMSDIGSSMSATVTAPIAGGLVALTEGTEEYRRSLGFLETAADNAKISQDAINDALDTAVTITGEADSSFETVSNLLNTGFNESQMQTALEGLSGAVTRFPDTLMLEGLADGLQETLATGEAIGPFAEMLERLGIDLDDFNEGLTKAQEEGDAANYVLETLADAGLNDTFKAFEDGNSTLFENSEATNDMKDAFAELGDTLAPIMTTVTNVIADLVEVFNGLDRETQNVLLAFAGILAIIGPILVVLGPFVSFLGSVASGIAIAGGAGAYFSGILSTLSAMFAPLGTALTALGGFFTALSAPVLIIVGVVAALIAAIVLAYNTSEEFRERVNIAFSAVREAIELAIGAVVEFVMSVWGGMVQWWNENNELIRQTASTVWGWIESLLIGLMNFLAPFLKSAWSGIQVQIKVIWELIKAVIDVGIIFIQGILKATMQIINGDWSGAWETMKNTASDIWDRIKRAISNIIQAIKDTVGGKVDEIYTKVSGVFDNIERAIKEPIETARSAVSKAIDKIKGYFDFDWSLPEIGLPKLPKISISGGFDLNPFDGTPMSVPSLRFFAKGGIMTQPTLFGMSGNTGFVGGEAGSEAILPLNDNVLGSIGVGILKALEKRDDENTAMPGNTLFVTVQSVLDGRVVADSMTDPIDTRLNNKSKNSNFGKTGRFE